MVLTAGIGLPAVETRLRELVSTEDISSSVIHPWETSKIEPSAFCVAIRTQCGLDIHRNEEG